MTRIPSALIRSSVIAGLALALAAAALAITACHKLPTEFSFGAGAPWLNFYHLGQNPWAVTWSQSLEPNDSESPPADVENRQTADQSPWIGACG